jgi:putative membrane protein
MSRLERQQMSVISMILIALIAVLHLYIMWFEMFAWESRGPKIFKAIPKDIFPKTRAMAANQGLYNGFLAAGLVWSLCIRDASWSINVAGFFLICVAIAGLYGSQTVSKRILFVQTIPASIALLSLGLF